jgi:DNA-binding response OmpR family regulator
VNEILVVTDASWIVDAVRAAVGKNDVVVHVGSGARVREVVAERQPTLVVLDSQIGSMGGIAVCHDLRLEEGMDRLPRTALLLLLDRRADVHLARRADLDGWVVKPLDSRRLSRAIRAVADGEQFFDDSFAPAATTAPVAP